MRLQERLDGFTKSVNLLDEYGITNLSKLATWLAPIAVMLLAIQPLQSYLGLQLWQAIFIAFVLEIAGLGVITNLSQAREYDVYYRGLDDNAKETHGLIELKLWHYQVLAAMYGVALVSIIVGLKVLPENPFMLNTAVLAIASVSFIATTAYMQRKTTYKLWAKVEGIVSAKEQMDGLLQQQRVEHVMADYVSKARIERLQAKINEGEALLEAAQMYQRIQEQMDQLPDEIVTIITGDDIVAPTPALSEPEPVKPKASKPKATKPKAARKSRSSFDSERLMALLNPAVKDVTELGYTITQLAEQLEVSRPTIYRTLGKLKESGQLPNYEGKVQ